MPRVENHNISFKLKIVLIRKILWLLSKSNAGVISSFKVVIVFFIRALWITMLFSLEVFSTRMVPHFLTKPSKPILILPICLLLFTIVLLMQFLPHGSQTLLALTLRPQVCKIIISVSAIKKYVDLFIIGLLVTLPLLQLVFIIEIRSTLARFSLGKISSFYHILQFVHDSTINTFKFVFFTYQINYVGSPLCSFCHLEDETILHLFYWSEVFPLCINGNYNSSISVIFVLVSLKNPSIQLISLSYLQNNISSGVGVKMLFLMFMMLKVSL